MLGLKDRGKLKRICNHTRWQWRQLMTVASLPISSFVSLADDTRLVAQKDLGAAGDFRVRVTASRLLWKFLKSKEALG